MNRNYTPGKVLIRSNLLCRSTLAVWSTFLLCVALYLVSFTTARADSHDSLGEFTETPTFSIFGNLFEQQPFASPNFPENLMGSFAWARGGNTNAIQPNGAISYSFSIKPDSAVVDLNVALTWKSKSADLDIDFGRWNDNQAFISLRQSINNTGNIESIYIPRLAPGTYSIIIRNNQVQSSSPASNTIFSAIKKNRRIPFAITWSGKNTKIKTLNIRAKLEGPYDNETGLMNDSLRTLGLIPAMEPYFLMAWGGDGEEIDPNDPDGPLSVTGNDAIVDWIKVQLYDFTFEGYAYVDSRSALLQRDGDIVDINGGPVQFWNLPEGNAPYYVAIQHRNHSTIITDDPHPLGANEPMLDFTLPDIVLFENPGNPSRKLQNGELLLWSGDVIRNGAIDESDTEASLEARGQTGYLFEDVNLDGTCDIDDTSIISDNQGRWDWG